MLLRNTRLNQEERMELQSYLDNIEKEQQTMKWKAKWRQIQTMLTKPDESVFNHLKTNLKQMKL